MRKKVRRFNAIFLAIMFASKVFFGDAQTAFANETPEVPVVEVVSEELEIPEGNPREVLEVPEEEIEVPEENSEEDIEVPEEEPVMEEEPEEEPIGEEPSGEEPGEKPSDEPEVPGEEPVEDIIIILPEAEGEKAEFYVVRPDHFENLTPDVSGAEPVVDDTFHDFYPTYYVLDGLDSSIDIIGYDNEHLDLLIEAILNVENTAEGQTKSAVDGLIVEKVGETLDANAGRENTVEALFDQDTLDNIFTYFFQLEAKILCFTQGDEIDWYVAKDSNDVVRVDGVITKGLLVVDPEMEAEYTFAGKTLTSFEYDGTNKHDAIMALINADIANESSRLPANGKFMIDPTGIRWNDSNALGAVRSNETANVGTYTVSVDARYSWSDALGAVYYGKNFTVEYTYSITPKKVVVTPYSYTKNQGEADPAFSGKVEGAVAGDPVTAYFWRIENSSSELPGDYIIYSTVVAGSNYSVVKNEGKLTIKAKELPPDTPPEEPETPPEEPETPPEEPETPPEEPETPPEEPETPPEETEITTEEIIEKLTEVTEVVKEAEDVITADISRNIPEEPVAQGNGEGDGCWIHWLIIILTVVDLIYTLIQGIRNKKKINALEKGEE